MPANQATIQETKNGQFLLTIPRGVAGVKGWKKGTKLEFIEDRFGTMTLKEV